MSNLVVIVVVAGWLVVSTWREPRRLRNGVLLMLLVLLLVRLLLAHLRTVAGVAFLAVAALFWLLLSIALILNGVTMLRKESRRPASMLSLALGLALLAMMTASVVASIANSSRFVFALMLVGLPMSYLGFVLAAFVVYAWLYGWWTRRIARPVEAVVVLGAGLRRGKPTPLLAARLDTGRVLPRSSGAPLIVSGGRGPDEPCSEASAMAEYLVEQGVDRARIVLEDRSRNTDQNLRFSAVILGERGVTGPVAVVTNNFHAFRAALLMRNHGVPGWAVGAPTARYFWPSAVLREYVAVLRDHRVLNGAMVMLACLPMLVAAVVAILR